MDHPAVISREVERVFSTIQHQRMADVPILNPRLRVEAVGFRRWGEGALGVLVTPWFMNLMLLPGDADAAPGSTVQHEFPSGRYSFIAAEEDELGPYHLCSLFSPMHAFENHEAAVATAEAALEELLAAPAPPPPPGMGRRQWLRGLLGEAS